MSKSTRKKALLFSYYWPPASGPGVQRWLKFVKFLREFGWDVIVITPRNGSYPNTDASLLDDIPQNTRIETTGTLEPFRLFNILSGKPKKGKTSTVAMGDIKGSESLVKKIGAYVRANYFIPDARKGWVPFAVARGKQVLKSHEIDLIITTGPPHSSHLIGLKLSKKFQLPWISDFRDPWTTIYYNDFLPRTERAKEKDYALETKTLKESAKVITVSDGIKTELEDRAKQIHVIPNGYDEEDFEESESNSNPQIFKLAYIGNFKANQNCTGVWKAIKELKESDENFKNKFRLSVTGNIHEEVLDALKRFDIEDLAETLPFVEHQKAVRRMCEAGALLFPIPQSENNKNIITGKIFEYLASKTPLLSVGPIDGDAAKILSDCNRHKMLDYENISGIKKRLENLFTDWLKSDTPLKHEGIEHEKFSRKNLTETLAAILNETASQQ